MNIKKRYLKWVDKNIKNLDETKTVLVIGATGSIGSALCHFLCYKKCHVILGGRNSKYLESLKDDLKASYNLNCDTLLIDLSNLESVNKALETLQSKETIDCIINNAGIYHQDKKYVGDFELTYLVNYLMPTYFYEKLLEDERFSKTKIVNVGSLTYDYHKLDMSDFSGEHIKTKTGYYSMTKQLLTCYTLYLKKIKHMDASMVHPGVSATNLFASKNKAYPKIFYIFITPLIKLIFMNPIKASLSLLKAIDIKDTKEDEWIGPRGLWHAWGYPNIQKLNKNIIDNDNLIKVKERTSKDLQRLVK